MASITPPNSLKPVSHYLKVAVEHDNRDPVIAYWARFAAVQKSLTIDKSSPEAKMFVISLLDWLETKKKSMSGNEAVTIEAAGEAHIENYALKLFSWADSSDRNSVFNKNVVKAFYTAGILFDILESLRPPLSDEFMKTRKYAKWKAAYIHNCLKNGEIPIPGEIERDDDDDEEQEENHDDEKEPNTTQQPNTNNLIGFVDPRRRDGSSSDNIGGGSNSYGTGTGSCDNSNLLPPPPPSQQQQPPPPKPARSSGEQVNEWSAAEPSSGSNLLSVESIAKAQKYCRWAGAALNFDDVGSAIENLEKALHLLKTGNELV